jgi:hypothetical protein
MGCGSSTTNDNDDFHSPVSYFNKIGVEKFDVIFEYKGKKIVDKIENFRQTLIENMYDLMIHSGACCYYTQLPRFEDCTCGVEYKLSADCNGNIISTNFRFSEEKNLFEIDESKISDEGIQLLQVLNNYVQGLINQDNSRYKILEELDQLKKIIEEEQKKEINCPRKIKNKISSNLAYIERLKKFICSLDNCQKIYIRRAKDTKIRLQEFRRHINGEGLRAIQSRFTKANEIYWNSCLPEFRFGNDPDVGLEKWEKKKKDYEEAKDKAKK